MNESPSPTEPRPRWRWSSVLHLAVVLLHPPSVFLLPWKAGERDARMAIGLWRLDPVRRRGILCALCYLSVGAGKVALSAFALLLIAIVLALFLNLRLILGVGWLGEALMAIIATIAIAEAAAAVLVLATSIVAAAVGQRMWIDHRADPSTALDGRWPPIAAESRRRNIAGILAVGPCVLVPVIFVLIEIKQPPGWMLFVSAMLGTIPAVCLARRTVARTPAECYPEMSHPGESGGPALSSNLVD